MTSVQPNSSAANDGPPPYPGNNKQAGGATTLQPPPTVFTSQPQPNGTPYYTAVGRSYQPYGTLRTPAIVLSVIACCCGSWLCSGPALLLALLPECTNKGNHRAMHISSIVLAVIAIVLVIAAIIAVIVIFGGTGGSYGYYGSSYYYGSYRRRYYYG